MLGGKIRRRDIVLDDVGVIDLDPRLANSQNVELIFAYQIVDQRTLVDGATGVKSAESNS